MSDSEKRIDGIIEQIHKYQDAVQKAHEAAAYARKYRMGRGAADDECGAYCLGVSLEALMLALGDELHDEAVDEDLHRANARLIAAAPELLDACEAALHEYMRRAWTDPASGTGPANALLAAIAKAEGRT